MQFSSVRALTSSRNRTSCRWSSALEVRFRRSTSTTGMMSPGANFTVSRKWDNNGTVRTLVQKDDNGLSGEQLMRFMNLRESDAIAFGSWKRVGLAAEKEEGLVGPPSGGPDTEKENPGRVPGSCIGHKRKAEQRSGDRRGQKQVWRSGLQLAVVPGTLSSLAVCGLLGACPCCSLQPVTPCAMCVLAWRRSVEWHFNHYGLQHQCLIMS